MKKLFTLILSLVALNLAYAADIKYDEETEFYYSINDDGVSVTLSNEKGYNWDNSKYKDFTGPLEIPSTIAGLPVTKIGRSAFNGSGISSVKIPACVKELDYYAFYKCLSLEKVEFEENSQLETIGYFAFIWDSGLTTFTVPASVDSIAESGLATCYLDEIVFEEKSKLRYLGKWALQNNNFKKVELPEGLEISDKGLCQACSYLEEFIYPSTISYIGDFQFCSCDAIKTIECRAIIPPELGEYAFYYDKNLNSDETNQNVTYEVPDGSYYLYKNDSKWGVYFTEEAEKDSNSVLVGNPIKDDYGNSYYFYYTDEDNKLIELSLYAIPDGATEVTIPTEVNGYAVSKIQDDVFKNASLKSLKFESSTPICDASIFASIAEGAILYVYGNQETYAEAGFRGYFTIYGYVEAGDMFTDNTFEYTVLENTGTVQITSLATEAASITINQNVSYNGLDFTVVSIADDVFNDKTDMTVTVTFSEPDAISLGTLSSTLTNDGKVGTLHVPVNTQDEFGKTDWAIYFNIYNFSVGTTFTDGGLTYQVITLESDEYSTTNTVKIVAFDCAESVTIPAEIYDFEIIGVDGVGDYADEDSGEGTPPVFDCADLKYVTIEASEPPFSLEAFESIKGNGAVLYVEKDNIANYTSTDEGAENWHEIFTIYGYIEAGDKFNYGDLYYQVTTVAGGEGENADKNTVSIIANDSYAPLTSIVIPTTFDYNGLTFTVTSIADEAFAQAESLTSVTVSSEELITLGTNAFATVEGAILYADGIQSIYANEDAGWQTYFTIYQYVEEGDEFVVDNIKYAVLEDLTTVGIVGIEDFEDDGETEITLVTSVSYNGLTFNVTSIDGEAFDDISTINVTVTFTDPSAISIGTISLSEGKTVGTLTAPSGYRDFFKDEQYDWATYFTIADNPYVVSGVNYYFQTDRSATVDSFNADSNIVLTDNVVGFTVQTIDEEVFAKAYEQNGNELLFIETSVVDPLAIQMSTRQNTSPEYYGTLTVPDGTQNIYAQTTWNEYFDFGGNDYLTTDGFVYYTFIITYHEDGEEDESTNKALKATSSKYSISLEVAYVDETATDVTIPRSIDLGDDSLYDTYDVTSLNGNAFKDCKDLVSVTLEAAIPVEDADALNYVPEACVIIVDDDDTKNAYSAVLSGVNVLTQEEYKAMVDAIDTVEISKATTETQNADIVIVARYNILGQRISQPTHGINIIIFSDGTVEKVVVK